MHGPALLGLSLWTLAAHAAEPINLHFNERPPYLVSGQGGAVTGLTADRAAEAFRQAGIPFAWVKTPALRQLALLKESASRDCLVGWYKNPERERFARYTLPIYRDGRIIALSSARTADLAGSDRLNRLLKNPELTLLVKDGYSYGADVDRRIRQLKPRIYGVAQESGYMLRMILEGNGSYLLAAEEEARALIAHEGLDLGKFRLIPLSDAPLGELRHIACSRKVPGREIEALNAAIRRLPGMPRP
ncbi:MAG: hypothetical protein HYV16_11570 [Gammaproteobacteria bacterium]|nr:hypothetical protein [Gammaproteobacteria bacterium]